MKQPLSFGRFFIVMFLLVLLILCTASVSAVTPSACWSFENNFTDEFGNYGAPVTYQSNYTSNGKVGMGGYFTNAEVDITNFSFYGRNNYTLSLWYNSVTTTRADVFGGQVDTHTLWMWDHQNNVNYLGLSVVVGDVPGISISPQQWSSTWYHLFIVGFENDTQYVYVNGSYVTPAVGTSVGKAMNDVNGVFKLGGPIYGTRYFNGIIDEVRIWNVSLADADVAADFNASAGVNCAYYQPTPPSLSCSYGDSLTKISYILRTDGSFPQVMNVTGQTATIPVLNCSNTGGASGTLQMKVNATYGSGTGFTNFYINNTAQTGSAWATTFPYNNFNNLGSKYAYLEHNVTFVASPAAAGSAFKIYWDSTSSSVGNENVYLEWQATDYSLKYEPGYDRTITGISAGTHTINLKVNYTADTFVMCIDGASCQSARAYTDDNNGYIGFAWGASGEAVNITKYTVDGYYLVQDICGINATGFDYTLTTSYQTIKTVSAGDNTGVWCLRNYTLLPSAKKSLMYSLQLI